jgi:hypothetical protein
MIAEPVPAPSQDTPNPRRSRLSARALSLKLLARHPGVLRPVRDPLIAASPGYGAPRHPQPLQASGYPSMGLPGIAAASRALPRNPRAGLFQAPSPGSDGSTGQRQAAKSVALLTW